MDYSLEHEDHLWVLTYRKTTKSSLSDPRVNSLLTKYLPADFSITRTKAGRPFAQSPVGVCADFSITHSNNLLIVAFSKNLIGIDLEFMKPRAYLEKISQRYFSPKEAQNSLEDFYRCWTAREAYIKIKAQSLRALPNISVDNHDTVWRIGEHNLLDYRIEFKILKKEYLLAVCREAKKLKKLIIFCYHEI